MKTSRHLPFGRVATYAVLLAWSLFCLVPVYWLIIASIRPASDLARPVAYIPFLDFAPTLEAWRFILGDPAENLLLPLFNSLIIGAAAAAVCVLTASFLIYGLTRLTAALRPVLAAAFIAAAASIAILFAEGMNELAWTLAIVFAVFAGAMMVGRLRLLMAMPLGIFALLLSVRFLPPVAQALPIYVLASHTGMLDSRLLLILLYTAVNLPVALWLLLPILGDKASEQEEAAQLDGATHVRIVFELLLPMFAGPVAVAGLVIFMLCWNEYLFAAYLTYNHAETLSTWLVGQLSMKEAQAGSEAEELAHLSAASVLMALPALALAAAVQRLLARSFTRGNL